MASSWAVTGWFTEQTSNNVGRITMAGVVTEFPIPTASSYPVGITAGPDGALWFTERDGNKIGRITTAGVITEFPLPDPQTGCFQAVSCAPVDITAGLDGALWFTEQHRQQGRADHDRRHHH